MKFGKEKSIKIAHIMGKWVGGGVESVVLNYYRYMDHKKFQFDFICDEDSTYIPYDEISRMNGRVIVVPPYQKIIKNQKALLKLFKKEKYDIVHSHINTLSVFPLYCAKRANIPIRIAHSHSTTNSSEFKKNILKQIFRPFSKVYATHYMCCSELAGRWLFGNKEYNKNKVFLLNNAIDMNKFRFSNELRLRKRKELSIDNDVFVIGHIGRFVEQKNHRYLLKIFKEILEIRPKSILYLVGDGPLLSNIKSLAVSLDINDSIVFLGQRNDVNELYQAFDVFVLPSLYEGLPVVGIEAQTAGLLCFFSTDMTEETKVIDSTRYISLKKSPRFWANEIVNNYNAFVRKDTTNEITKKHFNIEYESKKLEKIYEFLINKT